jgi:hypothetical protein
MSSPFQPEWIETEEVLISKELYQQALIQLAQALLRVLEKEENSSEIGPGKIEETAA